MKHDIQFQGQPTHTINSEIKMKVNKNKLKLKNQKILTFYRHFQTEHHKSAFAGLTHQ